MNINILESMSSILGGPVARQASALLGESDEGTRSGLRAAVPALLAGLMRNSADPGGASDLLRTVTSSSVDSGIESKLGTLMGNQSNLTSTLAKGEALFSSVLGPRGGSVAHAVSQVAGIKPSSATSLLALAAPVLMGFLKKQVTQNGLDARGLSSLLLGQRNALQKSGLDERVTSALGFGSMQTMLSSLPENPRERITETASTYTTPARSTPARVNAVGKWSWLPWAIGAAIAALALTFLVNRLVPDRRARTTTAAVSEMTRPSRPSTTRLASLPTQVYFDPGQADIDATDRETLANVASAARANGTPVAVTGYTDQSGNAQENLELAKNRADAVRQVLVSEGVPESRIEMKAPALVTGTDTAEQARRVEISEAR